MTRCLLVTMLLLFSFFTKAQYFSVKGKVTNSRLEPLALATVQVKDLGRGVATKEDGSYELQLESGYYEIAVSMIGYKPQLIRISVTTAYTQNFILEPEEEKSLEEVVVKGKFRDRSEEIIRTIIRHKEDILAAAGNYSGTVYIKAIQEDSTARKKKKKPLPDSLLQQRDNEVYQRMAMTEISIRLDRNTEGQVKEERTGVKKNGNADGLFYLSTTEADFSLYNNLLRSRSLSTVPFISPVSYSGLMAYKYKITGLKEEGQRKIYTISVRPKQLSNVTVEGELRVLDSAWVILSSRFVLPAYHVPEYDFFEVSQQYEWIQNKAWMITRQQFRYYSKSNKGKLSGSTVASYGDFLFNKEFPKKHFGAELSATTAEAYERDSSFWDKARTEPLTQKEIRFIQYKDSMYRATHTKAYLDSVDRITNRITPLKLLVLGQANYNREKERTWVFPPVLNLYQPFQLGGARISPYVNYSKTFKSKKDISVYANLSYGLRNKDLNGNLRLSRMYNPFNRGFYRVEVSRDFQFIYGGDAWINLIKRSNLYLNNALGLGHGVELANGLYLYNDFAIALRRSASTYKTNDRVDSLLGDLLTDNEAVSFDPYNAVYSNIKLMYTPGQQYIREPLQKVILGSKWPTFYAEWRKGIPGIFGSKINFDYVEFGIRQQLKLGITGVSLYTFKTGQYYNRKGLELVDYKFIRRGDPVLFMNPHEAFQMMDSTFPVFKRFYEGHYVHEFNGALINKIPFLKKLKLREIAGGGFLIAPERNLRYVEALAGVERVFKWPFNELVKFKLGVYVVGSAANQFRNPVQFKVGITSWDRKRNRWF